MSIRISPIAPASLYLATAMLAATPAFAGSWTTPSFGASLQGDLYTPTTPAASAAILVSIHYCSGHSSNAHSWFQSYADQYGFYIIAPDAGKNCFDSSLNRGGDPGAIVKMVQYVITNKNADASRVFAAGMSSGGCMTNTLLAIYPDVFAGGSAMPGFPAGLWPAGDTSCQKCSSSPGSGDTGQKYADMAKSTFSWSGTRPCSEQWVGGGDQYNFNGWLPVVASQFQILGNLGAEGAGTGAPSGWTRKVYKDTSGNVRLETNLGPSSQKHDLSNVSAMFGQVITFLGLDKPTGACGSASSGTGGSTSTGGATSTGTKTTGGATGAGGTKATGGATSAAGGTAAVGGTSATGGKASTSTGGKSSTSAGTTAAGGTKAAGGTSSNAGGTKATGGASSTGVPISTGGNGNDTGGTSAGVDTSSNGGSAGNATSAATSAPANTGGAGAVVGGGPSVGGESTVTNTTPGGSSSNQGGCSCRVAGKNDSSSTLWSLGLLGIAFAAWRRRQRKVG